MRRIRFIKLGLLCLTGCILIRFGRGLAEELGDKNQENVNTQASGLTWGQTLPDKETEEKLLALAQGSSDIAEIYLDRASYPPELLKALTLNQELLDFVKGLPAAGRSAFPWRYFPSPETKKPHRISWRITV